MAFIGGLLGIGGQGGGNFRAEGANVGLVNGTQNNIQANLDQQQNFINALNGQNAIGNQAQAYAQQQALANALSGVNGVQNQQNILSQQQGLIGQQQGLAGQLQGIAQGQGPNPAQAMLANQTGQNVAQQAALMAGQRGASANPALLARLAAQQGAATQQQAVGQGAALQAQQSLGALGQQAGVFNQIGQQQAAMGNTAANQIAAQQQALAMLNGQANQQVGNLQGAYGQNAGNMIANQGNLLGNINSQNSANSGVQQTVAGGQNNLLGGVTGGIGTVAGQLFSKAPVKAAHGGEIEPMSVFGKHLAMSRGGKVPVILSPGEKVLSQAEAKAVAAGKMDPKRAATVPGKAKVSGDSLKNDNYSTQLSAGDVVVPRTKAKDSDKAAKFVSSVLARSKHKGKK